MDKQIIKKKIETRIEVFNKRFCQKQGDCCNFLSEEDDCELFGDILDRTEKNKWMSERCQECIDKFGGSE